MRKLIQPRAAQGTGSVYITIEKQSHIIMQMIHYKMDLHFNLNSSTVLAVFTLWGIVGLHSRTHGNHMISTDRAAVKGVACQPSAASGVDRRATGDLRYRLGLDQLGLCKPALRSWNRSGDWQGANVVWPVLVWNGWIYAAWGPPEQHNSEFAEYDSIYYLRCRTIGCCNNRFWTSRRLG